MSKNRERPMKSLIRKRMQIVSFFLFLGLVSLFGRVAYLKIVHGEEYEIAAKTTQVSAVDVPVSPNRGSILDRNNQTLAISTVVYDIVLDCRVLSTFEEDPKTHEDERKKTIDALCAEFSDLDSNLLWDYITINESTGKPNLDTNWKVLKKKVPRETKEKLEEQNLKGVVYHVNTQRSYPLNTFASHVLGFIRGDASLGLEKTYNKEMMGVEGRTFLQYEGGNRATYKEISPIDGNTIVTTLDFTLQQYAEESVERLQKEYNPNASAAIIVDPNTCEILAMASTPNFNNNDPTTPIELETNPEFKQSWETMTEEQQYEYLNNTWNNFNVTSTFEPGSVMKPIVVAAALEEGIITGSEGYYCSGGKQVADWNIPCHLRTGHGNETLEDVLANSCNVGMMDIADKMGRDIMYKYLKDFGIGENTGIDLPAEENAASLMYELEKIGPVELATMSFGQSFSTTPIQVITAFSALINGGNYMRPYVVSKVLDKDGNCIEETKPEVVRKVISEEVSEKVRNMLVATVEKGTGTRSKVDGYYIGCKTGTSQQGVRAQEKYVVSYMNYLPADNPQYLVFLMMDRPENPDVATPGYEMKTLLENIIRYKNIEPSYKVSTKTAKSSEEEKVTVKDYAGSSLIGAAPEIESLGLKYEVVGTGNKIKSQVPKAGTSVEKGTTLILYVEKSEEGEKIKVPDLNGLTYEQSVSKLTSLGLNAVIDGEKEGTVISQSPSPGIFAKENGDVTLKFGSEKKEDS